MNNLMLMVCLIRLLAILWACIRGQVNLALLKLSTTPRCGHGFYDSIKGLIGINSLSDEVTKCYAASSLEARHCAMQCSPVRYHAMVTPWFSCVQLPLGRAHVFPPIRRAIVSTGTIVNLALFSGTTRHDSPRRVPLFGAVFRRRNRPV